MRFFKRALKTSAYVVSPAISIWVLTYQIPSTLITLWGNETEPTNYQTEGKIEIARGKEGDEILNYFCTLTEPVPVKMGAENGK